MKTEDIRNMAKAYAAVQEKAKKEAMDPVNPVALKGKHKDRKDKDIDNDGDVDSTDQYLHKRRKAISKSKKETASKSATTVSKDNKTDTDVQTQEDTKEEVKLDESAASAAAAKRKMDQDRRDRDRSPVGRLLSPRERGEAEAKARRERQAKREEVKLDEAGPKIDPAKMAAHMARNDKPKKMTSTQKSLASIRQKAEEVELDEISKDLAGRYIKKANVSTADAADQNARKSSMGQKSSIGKVMKRFKGVSTAADKLTGKAKVTATEELKKGDWVVHGGGKVGQVHNVSGDKASVDVKWNKTGRITSHAHSSLRKMKEEVELDEAATAQHKPDEKTSDTREKQLKRSKGEKDFVDQHKAEIPEVGDEPKVDALNFQKFKAMTGKIGKDNSRPADQKKGDNSIIPSATPVKQ